MASKKDFTAMNTGNRVQSSIDQATGRRGQQTTATPEEAAQRQANLATQGRKGCKAIRINMAFTPDNHEYIKLMAKITGKSMTEFANYAIEKHREEHQELYDQAKAIIEKL